MATVTVQKKEPTPPEIETVTIVLAVNEALAVLDACGWSYRATDVYNALYGALRDSGFDRDCLLAESDR